MNAFFDICSLAALMHKVIITGAMHLHTLRHKLQDVTVSVNVPSLVVAVQQQLLLPELPASSSKRPGEPQALQVVLQVAAGSSIPAANTAEVRCQMWGASPGTCVMVRLLP
jgi:hypothetical protein